MKDSLDFLLRAGKSFKNLLLFEPVSNSNRFTQMKKDFETSLQAQVIYKNLKYYWLI